MQFILVLLVAFVAGIEGILDEFEFHQPIVACTLIGLVTNHLAEGLLLGGSLQLIALGWANIGAAVAPDVCLASVISSILMVHGLNSAIDTRYVIAISIALAIPLSLVGLSLTKVCRNLAIKLVHKMDETKKVSYYQWIGICMQGIRVLIPTIVLLLIPSTVICSILEVIPVSIYKGLLIGSGVVCVVGFAIVANVLGSKFTYPFYMIGFGLACISSLSLLSLCFIGGGLVWLFMLLNTKETSTKTSDDPLGDILNDYEEVVYMKKSTRLKVCLNHQYLQGSWNFERMQNGGWCYGLLPALKELYPNKEDYDLAVDRHLKFYNTHPYVSAPIVGIVLAMEEEKAKGSDITDEKINEVKVGLMGPLAGVGDPVFWFTMRPILAAVAASLALSKNILGPIFFFVAWNVLRFGFLWITQELGYKKGTKLVTDLSDSFLKNVTLAASMLGMFVVGILVQRFVSIDVVNIQSDLDMVLPGLLSLCLFFVCTKVLKKGFSPVLLIVILFILCIILEMAGILVI